MKMSNQPFTSKEVKDQWRPILSSQKKVVTFVMKNMFSTMVMDGNVLSKPMPKEGKEQVAT